MIKRFLLIAIKLGGLEITVTEFISNIWLCATLCRILKCVKFWREFRSARERELEEVERDRTRADTRAHIPLPINALVDFVYLALATRKITFDFFRCLRCDQAIFPQSGEGLTRKG